MIEATMPSSWIFTKGDQSIHIARPEGHSLIVRGPGAARQRHNFTDEAALQGYQVSMAEQLAERGWLLFGVDCDRRIGQRRAARRNGSDRRTDDGTAGAV
jgi:hypothetical protein